MVKVFLSFIGSLLVVMSFNGCSTKQEKVADDYYDRANKAAKEAHEKFDKE